MVSRIDIDDIDAFIGTHGRILREEFARDADLAARLPADVLASAREYRDVALARADRRWKDAKAALQAGRDPLGDPGD